ncbi:MAG: hypothetical protein AB1627_08895 [Chloroflexota bacterium]
MIAGTRLAILAGALLVTGLGLGMTMTDSPSLGVEPDAPGGVVQHVLPGGPAWRYGIREGQLVLELDDTDDDTSTLVTSVGGNVGYSANVPGYRLELAGARPVAGMAVLLALAALALYRWRWPLAIALSVVAAAIGAEAALLASDPLLTSAAAVTASAIAAAALATARWHRGMVLLGAITGAIGVAWVVARFAAPSAFEPADIARRATYVTAGGLLLLTAVPLDPRRWLEARRSVSVYDVLFAAGLITAVILLWRVVEVSPVVLLVLGAVAVAVYAVVRGLAGRLLDRLASRRPASGHGSSPSRRSGSAWRATSTTSRSSASRG